MTLPPIFHPSIRAWFAANFAEPTEVQRASWPLIADGRHVLATAPTGSGKTLTAFLWALNRFADGSWEAGRTRVVYISPLKALNNDIRRNLLEPLQVLREDFDFPELRVMTRSGDTPQAERQRMLRRPPDILITTPESLSLLLTTVKGRQALSDVETVILDEIHSIVDNRRGVQLMTSLERLVRLSGECQRIALSATVRPLDAVARYVAGSTADGRPRELAVVDSAGAKAIELRVRFPEAARAAARNGDTIWDALSDSFRDVIEANRSTLFFTNSRRLAEKITLKINQDQLAPLAYAHHGSLSREIRGAVEQRMKDGELKAIVATNSLELGIDVGHLDEVVMVQSPPSVASALQRIGRAGHAVGEISVGTVYPSHAQDFLEAAVLAEAIEQRRIEPLQPLENALDVLAQIVISITATDPWPLDELYALLRCAAPYRRLARDHFDLVIDMLAGRYAGSRVRELSARVSLDREQQTVQAKRSAVFALYNSGGTIPDRGYYQLRHSDTGAVLGELDEEFVWEATTGQVFTLGTQSWQVLRITHNDVMVRAAKPGATAPPFWRSEDFNRSVDFSLAITEYLAFAERTLREQGRAVLEADLTERRGFDASAATELVDYLLRQREATRSELPHRHHLLLEWVRSGPGGYRGPDSPQQLVLHTFWGGRLNRPWALALAAAWRRAYDAEPEIHADNNAIVLSCQQEPDPHALLALVSSANLESLLRESLERSGFFGARFRECAGRSLLLNRQRFNQRLPLWMSRLQAKKLMSATSGYSDFPVLLETWRTCLEDEFAIAALSQRLLELHDGAIEWTLCQTPRPSPFAGNVTFGQVSRYMYADDTPELDEPSALRADLIASAVQIEALRPRLECAVIDDFEAKRQRTALGYPPVDADDWAEWLKERVLLPEREWSEALRAQLKASPQLWVLTLGERRWATHRELVHGLYASGLLPGPEPEEAPLVDERRDATQLAQEMLSFYGPLREQAIIELLPSIPEALLEVGETLIYGQLIADDPAEYWCDADNFERLLRLQRASRRSQLEARPARELAGFWANWQRLGVDAGAAREGLVADLELLRGYSAPVATWLQELLPPRCAAPDHQVDQLLQEEGLTWLGTGNECITLCYPEELGLFAGAAAAERSATGEEKATDQRPAGQRIAACFVDPQARYGFFQLADQASEPLATFSALWWEAVWQGALSADSLAPLRQGLARGFTLAAPSGDSRHSRRRRARGLALGWPGSWRLVAPQQRGDALSELEDAKERVRLLLDRYGVLCREIVNREWRWRDAFRALRLLELAGEVTTGYFFSGLSGPQFAAPRAVHALGGNPAGPAHFWCCAQDPAAPSGLGLDWPELPQRRAGNYLAFYRGALALVVENAGRRLRYQVPPDHPELDRINAPLVHCARLRKRGVIDTINDEAVAGSPYRAALERVLSLERDHKQTWFHPLDRPAGG